MIAARSLCREVWTSALGTLAVLLLVTVGLRLSGYLEDAAGGRLAAEVIGRVLLLRLPEFLLLLGPLAFFAAVLLTLARTQAHSELVALHAAGLGGGWLLRVLLCAALPIVMLLSMLSLVVVPATKSALTALLAEQRGDLALAQLMPRRFQSIGGSGRVVWAAGVDADTGRLSDVFLLEAAAPGSRRLITARHGELRIDHVRGVSYLELGHGQRYLLGSTPMPVRAIQFDRYVQRLDAAALGSPPSIEAQATRVLWDSADGAARAELHWRAIVPLLLPVLTLLAWALAGRPPGPVTWQRLLLGIGAMLLLLLGLVGTRSAVEAEHVPVIVLWLPLVGAGLLAGALGRRHFRMAGAAP